MVLIMGAIALVVFQMDSYRVEGLDDGKNISRDYVSDGLLGG